MIEIKFRAWITDTKNMFYQKDTVDENRTVFWKKWETTSHVSDPMQFTGLLDKNGKEIYVGDILMCEGWKATGPFPSAALEWHLAKQYDPTIDLVVFDKGVFGVVATKPTKDFIPIWEFAHHAEIIGNIYEHPEKLKS